MNISTKSIVAAIGVILAIAALEHSIFKILQSIMDVNVSHLVNLTSLALAV